MMDFIRSISSSIMPKHLSCVPAYEGAFDLAGADSRKPACFLSFLQFLSISSLDSLP